MEKWAPIVLDGIIVDAYLISSFGRVKTKDGVFISQVTSGDPKYFYVNLNTNNSRRLVRVHRLVAETFMDNVYGKKTVDHIDRNRFNNSLYNLRWADRYEQQSNIKSNVIVDLIGVGEVTLAEAICIEFEIKPEEVANVYKRFYSTFKRYGDFKTTVHAYKTRLNLFK